MVPQRRATLGLLAALAAAAPTALCAQNLAPSEQGCPPDGLASLRIRGLTPAFEPSITAYGVPARTDSVELAAAACDPAVQVYARSVPVPRDAPARIWIGDGRPTDIVLYRNWREVARYVVTPDATLPAAPPAPAIDAIRVAGLDPGFDPAITSYRVPAPGGDALTLTLFVSEPGVEVHVQSQRVTPGVPHTAWAPPGQRVDVVAYRNWTEIARYTVEVDADPPQPDRPGDGEEAVDPPDPDRPPLGEDADDCMRMPSYDQCSSPTWLRSGCGGDELRRLTEGGSRCAEVCVELPPTAVECQDENWLQSACGQLEIPRLREAIAAARRGEALPEGRESSVCARVEREPGDEPGYELTLGLSPPELVVAPGQTPQITPDEMREVRYAHYRRGGQSASGGTSQYQGHRMREWTRASSGSPGGNDPLGLFDLFVRQQWDDNGIGVGSCREYVYEKYYDYSLFEDATMGLGHDWRGVYDVAYAGEDASAPRSAIGRRGVLGVPLAARDGTALPHPIQFPLGPQPKNPFFTFEPLTDAERDDKLSDPQVLFDSNPPELQGSCGFSLDAPVFCDDDLHQRLQDGFPLTVTESFAWHEAKSEALAAAGFHDEQLAVYEQVVADFESLLFRRQKQVEAIVAWWKRHNDALEAALPDEMAPPVFDPSIFEHSMLSDVLRRQRVSAFRRMNVQHLGAFAPGFQLDAPIVGLLAEGAPVSMFKTMSAPFQLFSPNPANLGTSVVQPPPPPAPGSSGGIGVGGVVDPTPDNPQSVDYLVFLQRGLMRLDAEIEASMLHARDLGCLELGAANPCDWSPRRFAQRVQDLYTAERENDYQHCLENTPDGFAKLLDHDLGIENEGERQYPAYRTDFSQPMKACFVQSDGTVGGVPDATCADCNDWTQGTQDVDWYFNCLESQKKLVLDIVQAQLGPEVIGPDRKLKLRGSSGELHRIGNENFNVEMAYGFGWSLGEFEGFVDAETPNHCELKPEGYGHFDVTATALFFTQSLVHASAHARLGEGAGGELEIPESVTPNRLEVQILDQDLFDPIDTVIDDHKFNVVKDEWSEDGTLVSVQATFTIVFVPVTIKGGIAGAIGVGYSIDGEVPLEPQSGDCDILRFTAGFSPFAQVDGFASVSIDAVIAEAGIRIDLTIVRVDLPFDVTLAIGINDDFDLILDIETNLDLIVSMLSGSLSVYFRVLWEEHKGVIFSWDGLRFVTNLLNAQVEVPLLPLREAAIALSELSN
jgi:hypothetical protein